MGVREFLAVLRTRWLSVVVGIAVCVLAAIGLTIAATPMYEATARSFVNTSLSTDAGILQGSQFTTNRMKSYGYLVESPAVLQPVIKDLHLAMTVDELAGEVSASSPLNTVILDVTARDRSARRAAQIANQVSVQLKSYIENTIEKQGTNASPVTVNVTRNAQTPTSPVSPRPEFNIALGVLAGLALGLALAVTRQRLDRTVKSPDALEELVGHKPIGIIPFDAQMSRDPLPAATVTRDDGTRSEPFRRIRTNLQFVDVDRPLRSLTVTSAVPHEGKSISACNLAITMAQSGSRVCLVEGDLRRPKVAEYLGVDGSVGLTNVLVGERTLDEVISEWGDGLIDFLAAGTIPPDPSELLGSRNMAALLAELEQRYDFVLIDAPPLVPVSDAAILARATDGALVAVRHGHSSRDQIRFALDAIDRVGARVVGTFLVAIPGRQGQGYSYSYTAQERPSRWHWSKRAAAPSRPHLPSVPRARDDVAATTIDELLDVDGLDRESADRSSSKPAVAAGTGPADRSGSNPDDVVDEESTSPETPDAVEATVDQPDDSPAPEAMSTAERDSAVRATQRTRRRTRRTPASPATTTTEQDDEAQPPATDVDADVDADAGTGANSGAGAKAHGTSAKRTVPRRERLRW